MKSLLCQKGADYEIVLVDDGSTDSSDKMCDDYAKQYPDIVRVIHKENEGSLIARHLGIISSRGEWIMCVDSDDYVNDCLLKRIVELISNHQPDMVMFHYSYVNSQEEIVQAIPAFKNDTVFDSDTMNLVYEKKLISDDINSMCLKAISRDILDNTVDYDNCGIKRLCDDALQVLPLITKSKKIVYVTDPLYFYRKGHSSITSHKSYDRWLEIKSCFLITEKYLDVWGVSDELRQKFYTHNTEVLSNFLRWLFAQNSDDLPLAKEEIIHTISKSPAYSRCIQMYNKSYAATSYLKFSVPLVMKKLKKENVKGLRRFFALEKRILKIK